MMRRAIAPISSWHQNRSVLTKTEPNFGRQPPLC